MKKILLFVLATAACATVAMAAPPADTINGFLMDKECATEMKMDAATHDVDCLQMASCAKSGYGVVTSDGKFIAFDAKGNKDAAAWAKASKAKTNLKITVTGTWDKEKNTIKVDSIK